ncbi:MAG: putative quinol monooxygenase [Planctomycetota bacterium]
MIHVIAHIEVKPGTLEDFLKAFKDNVPAVLAEEGCVEYQPAIDIEADMDSQNKNPNRVIVIEKWESLAHLDAHSKAPHMITFRESAGSMIEKIHLNVLQNG